MCMDRNGKRDGKQVPADILIGKSSWIYYTLFFVEFKGYLMEGFLIFSNVMEMNAVLLFSSEVLNDL